MNALSRAFSYATTLLGREAHFPYSRSFCTKVLTFSCKRSFEQYGLKAANLQILLTRFHAQCCSSRRVSGKSSRKKKPIPEPVVGEKRKDDFFVIRKGDVVGVYKRLDDCQAQAGSSNSCILEFGGTSKGNPGQAGAGAVLWKADASLICRLQKGLGHQINNFAEYEAIFLGLEHVLKKGYTKIRFIGDSKLVCLQMVRLKNCVFKLQAALSFLICSNHACPLMIAQHSFISISKCNSAEKYTPYRKFIGHHSCRSDNYFRNQQIPFSTCSL